MKPPSFHTKELLKPVLSHYCRGQAVDIGAGRGKYKAVIQAYSDYYISLDDLSSEYQFGGHNPCLDVIGNVLALPFVDQAFDTAICTEVIEHVPDPFQLFSELARILKPGGHLLLSSSWAAAYHREPKDYWRFSPDAYAALAEKFGLELVEVHKKGGLFSLLLYFITRNIELNMPTLEKIRKRLSKFLWLLEIMCDRLDKRLPTEDAIGHLIVAKKR